MTWLGVDVGGTFTDLVLFDEEAQDIRILKTPSTPKDQSEGILTGIRRLGFAPEALTRFVHGTTVATNTALERDGAKLAIVTTAGHKDVLVVGKGNRTVMYNIKAPPVRPLVRRSDCYEVRERRRADGSVQTPLNEDDVHAVAERLAADGVEAVAICFLNAYADDSHERRCAEILFERLPGVVVATSAEVLPEYREFERFSTTALNAYVAPRLRRYVGRLRGQLRNAGLRADVSIMTSNGGSLPASRVEALPILSMLSGPAGGVIAASAIGTAAGYPNLITCDMGGTSTDVCLLRGGEYGMTTEGRVGVFPVKIRQIDIHTVGVGGGSIASRAGGVLSVGPRSAGSMPGPAAFGRGGTEPTITDANVVLGRIGTDVPLGGEIQLDLEAARSAVGRLGEDVGLETEAMADGILRIATVQLAMAIKEVSILRGIDPRDFTLLPYGGAGALHAAAIAEELGMRQVLVPPLPGNFSALGLLIADLRRDLVQTRIARTAEVTADDVRARLADLVAAGTEELDQAGFPAERHRFVASLDMRYSGQSFELSVPVALDVAEIGEIEKAFAEVYRARYGGLTAAAVEIVSYRVAAWGLSEKLTLPQVRAEGRSAEAAETGRRPIAFGGAARDVPVLARDRMPVGHTFSGPALVEEDGASTVVPPGWSAALDPVGCLVLSRI
ncbi:hydantoinase/oxoprolinase family protein [Enterovirga rhinocerotis]|uniref:N-methylhydantoinase A n=1 Tax=Enterovirga rhinocerotis TaxID=1339210 RepID=A0A4R7BT75_9HYPH|nr:hydantoinase/oxoprolinase family protein [Enterovirga rhinocerotis]TDR88920.1 N-methylhydantoinase A [Enterovirga rhinocerotis]